MKNSNNILLWEQKGDNLLVIQPFMDSLIARGEGSYLIDMNGRRILDLAAGQFCNILGNNNTDFTRRLKEQLDTQIHLGGQYISPVVLEAASRLAEVTPGKLNKVIFLSTGSEANECAMRIAKKGTGRNGMLAFTRGYYGISLATGSLSAMSDYPWKIDFQPAPINQYKLITPNCNRCPIGLSHPSCQLSCLNVSLEMIAQHLDNIAGVIVEPIISAGGMIFPPKDYIQKLYATVHDIGALFIVDEAQTGFGRCGRWFDIQNYQVEPDILVLSKTAGNGYPVSAVIVTDSLASKLEKKCFTHLSSHQNDPLAAAAVLAVIDIVKQDNLIERSQHIGNYFIEQLKELKARHSLIADVRGRGLMIGMELSSELGTGKEDAVAFNLALLCEHKGLHITFSYFEPVVRFIPPLTISKEEIDMAIEILDEALGVIESGKTNFSNYIPKNKRSGPFIRHLNGYPFTLKLLGKMWKTSPQEWTKIFKKLRKTS